MQNDSYYIQSGTDEITRVYGFSCKGKPFLRTSKLDFIIHVLVNDNRHCAMNC